MSNWLRHWCDVSSGTLLYRELCMWCIVGNSCCKQEVKSQRVFEQSERGVMESVCHRELRRVVATAEGCQRAFNHSVPAPDTTGSFVGESLTEISLNPVRKNGSLKLCWDWTFLWRKIERDKFREELRSCGSHQNLRGQRPQWPLFPYFKISF